VHGQPRPRRTAVRGDGDQAAAGRTLLTAAWTAREGNSVLSAASGAVPCQTHTTTVSMSRTCCN